MGGRKDVLEAGPVAKYASEKHRYGISPAFDKNLPSYLKGAELLKYYIDAAVETSIPVEKPPDSLRGNELKVAEDKINNKRRNIKTVKLKELIEDLIDPAGLNMPQREFAQVISGHRAFVVTDERREALQIILNLGAEEGLQLQYAFNRVSNPVIEKTQAATQALCKMDDSVAQNKEVNTPIEILQMFDGVSPSSTDCAKRAKSTNKTVRSQVKMT